MLRSNGRLCIFWSAGHHPDDLADALQAAYQQVLPDNFPSLVIGYAANKASDPTADSGAVMDAIKKISTHMTEMQNSPQMKMQQLLQMVQRAKAAQPNQALAGLAGGAPPGGAPSGQPPAPPVLSPPPAAMAA